ncbi:MAG TPA: N(G),N(G)-dimethylarginine dimethylaminohydrolase, partial [Microbacterium sp.]|nr:N(G),N(G)-dimethylarginine dimethylaminohydrolase [Microbacterium sp.]
MVFGDLAVLCRAGAPSRRGEASTVRTAAEASGLEIAVIEAPGTLDGGDVLKVGRTVHIGRSARTNDEGIAQLRALLQHRGWEVIDLPVTRVLHFKSAVTALPDGT